MTGTGSDLTDFPLEAQGTQSLTKSETINQSKGVYCQTSVKMRILAAIKKIKKNITIKTSMSITIKITSILLRFLYTAVKQYHIYNNNKSRVVVSSEVYSPGLDVILCLLF